MTIATRLLIWSIAFLSSGFILRVKPLSMLASARPDLEKPLAPTRSRDRSAIR